MGKVDEKKQQKFEQLLTSAQELFLSKGIVDTSISDITSHAGVAKGTFYLYFQDKYSIRDYLVSRSARRLFRSAHSALLQEPTPMEFEDRIIYITDHIIHELEKNRPMLHFIAKNLSWGLFQHMVSHDIIDDNLNGRQIFENVAQECGVILRDPDVMVFLIVELTSSSTYTALLGRDPIPLEKLLPYLNDTIRAIVRNHMC